LASINETSRASIEKPESIHGLPYRVGSITRASFKQSFAAPANQSPSQFDRKKRSAPELRMLISTANATKIDSSSEDSDEHRQPNRMQSRKWSKARKALCCGAAVVARENK
jgi:hypothetical protein